MPASASPTIRSTRPGSRPVRSKNKSLVTARLVMPRLRGRVCGQYGPLRPPPEGSRRRGPTAQRRRDALEDRAPVVAPVLAEQPRARIPRAIRPVDLPAPVRHVLQSEPYRPPEGAGQMRDGAVAGDDEIELHHHRGGIEKPVGTGVECVAEALDLEPRRRIDRKSV